MSKIEESIDVKVPVQVAYDQWTQFGGSPRPRRYRHPWWISRRPFGRVPAG